ncbi:MAG: hypothetical protein AB7E05_13670 [Sphingobium sp.]
MTVEKRVDQVFRWLTIQRFLTEPLALGCQLGIVGNGWAAWIVIDPLTLFRPLVKYL